MKISERVNALIKDPAVNDSDNDVRWFSGWTHQLHTAQFRFSSDEASSLIKKISSFGPRTQRALLRELHRRVGNGVFVGQVSFISSRAASLINKLAAQMDLDLNFPVVKKRAPAPMG